MSKITIPPSMSRQDFAEEDRVGYRRPFIKPKVNPDRTIMANPKVMAEKDFTVLERSRIIVESQITKLYLKSRSEESFTNNEVLIFNGLLTAMQTLDKIENKKETKGEDLQLSTEDMIEILNNSKQKE